MGVLNAVLEYKARKEAQDAQAAQAIPQAVQAFITGRQEQTKNQNDMLNTQINAAKAGFRIDGGKLVPDETFQQNAQRSVYSFNPLTGALEQAGTVKKGDYVRNTLSEEDLKKKSQIQRDVTTENPEIDAPTQSAIASYDFLEPRIKRINEILDANPWGDNWEKIAKQIVVNPDSNELLVPDDYKNDTSLEELIGLLNDNRITGFGLAGSAFTEFEGKRVESGFDPRFKSIDRFRSDLNRTPDFFKAKIKAGTTGLKAVREKYSGMEQTVQPGQKSGIKPKTVGKFKIVGVQ